MSDLSSFFYLNLELSGQGVKVINQVMYLMVLLCTMYLATVFATHFCQNQKGVRGKPQLSALNKENAKW